MNKQVALWIAWSILAAATLAIVILKLTGSDDVTTSAVVWGSIVTIVLPITLIAGRHRNRD